MIVVLKQAYTFGAETHLLLELQVFLSSSWPPLLEHLLQRLLAVQLSGEAHDDSVYTAMNAMVH